MILITGATGTIGKELVKLLARPEEPVRVMVHNRSKAASIAYPGAIVVEGDFAKPDTLRNTLGGIEKVFLLGPPTEEGPQYEANFIDVLANSHVEHIVKLSALGAHPDSTSRFLRAHAENERRLIATGIHHTILRPSAFMQNLLNFRESIITRGEFYAPMGDGRIGMVDARDVAAVAAEVLEEHGHDGKIYDITGPESLSYADIAARLTEALGKTVTYVDVPPEAARDGMVQAGVSPWLADGLLELYAIWRVNGASEIADTVNDIAKKEPISFRDFAHDYAPQFGRTGPDTLVERMDEINLDKMTPGA